MSTCDILYIGGGLPDKDASGIRVFCNALALKEAGYEVVALSLDKDCITEYSTENEGLRICHQPMPQGNTQWLKYLFELERYVDFWKACGRPRIIITYEQPAFSFLRLLRFCHRHGVKLVLDVTEWLTANHLRGITRLVKEVEVFAEMRYAYNGADAYIVIGSYLKKYFGRENKPALMVPTLQCKKMDLDIPLVAGTPRRLIYAGQMSADKDDLYSIISALDGLKGFVFNIFGITREQYLKVYPEHRAILDRYKKEIVFNGRVPHDVVVSEQIKADYTLVVRRSTRRNNAGFPTKFGESVMYGTPVIATNFSDIEAYIERYHVGYMVPSFEKLHDSFADILSKSDEELNQMKRNCIDCMFFDYRSHIREFDTFIKAVYSCDFQNRSEAQKRI